MKTSTNGISIIKKFEALELSSYLDVSGVLTIGYGHTQGVFDGMTITEAQADEFLKQDVKEAENAVNHYVVNKGVELTQNQFDALVSLVFNLGSGNIFTHKYSNGYPAGSSLYNKLLQGKISEAADHFLDFVKSGGVVVNGLVKRRNLERDLFKKKTSFCPQCSALLHSLLSY